MRVSGILLFIDSSGGEPKFADLAEVTFSRSMVIHAGADQGLLSTAIGHALVKRVDKVLHFEGMIYSYEFQKLPREAVQKFFPCASGIVLEKRDGLVYKARIDSIFISTSNQDPRIPPLFKEYYYFNVP